MSKLPVLSGNDLVRILSKVGFVFDRQKGSHIILYRSNPPATITVPDHKELDRGTLRAIIRQVGLTPEQLRQYL